MSSESGIEQVHAYIERICIAMMVGGVDPSKLPLSALAPLASLWSAKDKEEAEKNASRVLVAACNSVGLEHRSLPPSLSRALVEFQQTFVVR